MELTEQTQQQREHTYRVNFKQSAKGHWQGEFTVRADNLEELNTKLTNARNCVEANLEEMNSKEVV